jgi:hypothetical protein
MMKGSAVRKLTSLHSSDRRVSKVAPDDSLPAASQTRVAASTAAALDIGIANGNTAVTEGNLVFNPPLQS